MFSCFCPLQLQQGAGQIPTGRDGCSVGGGWSHRTCRLPSTRATQLQQAQQSESVNMDINLTWVLLVSLGFTNEDM